MDVGSSSRFYVIRPDMLATSQVAEHIKLDKRAQRQREYHIIFVPQKLATCEYILEKEGVFGYVTILEWSNLHLIPMDEHLLSLERNEFPRALYIDNDLTMLRSVARSICMLENIYGRVPVVRGLGELAKSVLTLVKLLREQERVPPPSHLPKVDQLVILDRRCDLVTPLFSQLTYEGILDDTFGIRSGFVELKKEITKQTHGAKVLLNSKDPVYAVIRSLVIPDVPGVLSDMSRQIRSSYNEGRGSEKSINELRQFVKRLPELRKKHDSLAIHLNASEAILEKKKSEEFQRQLFFERAILESAEKGVDKLPVVEYLEECMHRQLNLHTPLRLLCLMSTTNNGIKPKYLRPLKQLYLHSYGYRHLGTFHQLERVGLLREKPEDTSATSKSVFRQLSKVLNLVPTLSSDVKPKESFLRSRSYVYGGAYKPLSCAIVESVVRSNGWREFDDIKGWQEQTINEVSEPQAVLLKPRVVLVYYIGGCTFSEIDALQLLGDAIGIRFIVATTNTINARSFLDLFAESD